MIFWCSSTGRMSWTIILPCREYSPKLNSSKSYFISIEDVANSSMSPFLDIYLCRHSVYIYICAHMCPHALICTHTCLPICLCNIFFPDVNSRYWFKPIKPSRVLCVLDNVVLTDEGTWGAAANHHYITIMFGCGCNYLYHRDLHLVLRSLHKNLVSYDSYRILSRNSLNSILFDSYINHHEAKLPINWEHKLKMQSAWI